MRFSFKTTVIRVAVRAKRIKKSQSRF